MANVDDFFIADNSVGLISEASYENIDSIIEEIDAFSRMTYKSVYIIDYYKRNFLNVPKEDLDFLLEITRHFLANIRSAKFDKYFGIARKMSNFVVL